MKRRDFLKKSAAGLAGGSVLAGCTSSEAPATSATVQTGRRLRWRLASSFPSSLDTIYGAAEVLASRVSSLTDGRFDIKVHQAGELCPALQVLDNVEQGAVEIGHTAGYYYTGKHDALAFDTAVPFGLDARQHLAWLRDGGREQMGRILSDFGIVHLPGGNTGVQMGGWFRRRIGSLADLQGLTMRIPGMGGKVMSALGATALNIPGGEIFQALERGRIDATEWVGPYDDQKLGFHQICKHYYYPGWWEPGPALSFYVGQSAWDKLSPTYQSVLEAAAAEAGMTMLSEYDRKNPVALDELLAEGVELIPYPNEILVEARKVSEAMFADSAAKDPSYRRVFEHWNTFRKRSSRWLSTAELSYGNFAYRG